MFSVNQPCSFHYSSHSLLSSRRKRSRIPRRSTTASRTICARCCTSIGAASTGGSSSSRTTPLPATLASKWPCASGIFGRLLCALVLHPLCCPFLHTQVLCLVGLLHGLSADPGVYWPVGLYLRSGRLPGSDCESTRRIYIGGWEEWIPAIEISRSSLPRLTTSL